MGVSVAASALAIVLVFSWPWSDPGPRPPSPLAGENGMDTSFGRIESEWHRSFRLHPVDWEARVTIKPDATPDAAMFMFAFVAESKASQVRFLSLTTADGDPVPLAQDQREEDALVPKVFVNATEVPTGNELVLRGDVTLDNNGRYQLGALVIAFDARWEKAWTTQGEVAQIYGYGFVGANGLDTQAGAPPFEGKGNVLSGLGFVTIMVMAATALGGLLYGLRVRPVQPGKNS